MFEKAIELDDSFALAWAGAADCHSWLCMWYEGSSESLQQADECSLRALQLAPGLAEAHASRAYALSVNGRYEESEAEFKAAIALDPQLYEAYYYAGRTYFAEGKFRQAVVAFKQAAAIRPDDVTAAALTSTALKALGDEDEHRLACQRSIEVTQNYLALNPDDALAMSRLAGDFIATGDTEKGLEMAERAYSINPRVCRYNVACTYIVTGETERAFDLLEEHARAGAVHVDWVMQDSDWESVHEHPRFKQIVEIARQKQSVQAPGSS